MIGGQPGMQSRKVARFLLTLFAGVALAQNGRITSGAYSVQPAPNDVAAFRDQTQLLSFRTLLKPANPECSSEETLEVVSLAGPYLGIRQDSYSHCKEAAHPSTERKLATFDLSNSGRPIAITDLFPEAEVVRALSQDPVLTPYIEKKPATLKALLAALPEEGVIAGDTPCTFEVLPGGFAMHHMEAGQVAVRVSLIPVPGACRGLHPELGILLPVPASLKAPLVAAPPRTPKAKLVFEVR